MGSSDIDSSYIQLKDDQTNTMNETLAPSNFYKKGPQTHLPQFTISTFNSSGSSISANEFKLQIDDTIMSPMQGVNSSQNIDQLESINTYSSPTLKHKLRKKTVAKDSGSASHGLMPPKPSLADFDDEDLIVAQIEAISYLSQNFPPEESQFEKRWKRDLYLLLEDPSSSPMAFYINFFLAGLISFSVVLTTIETIPAVKMLQWTIWSDLELITVIVYTFELCLRTAAHSGNRTQLWEFLKSPMTILDILAVLPYYVTLPLQYDTSVEFRFTVLRVFRLFRLFRAYKYTSRLQLSIEVMMIALRKSLDALGTLFFFMSITIVSFSSLLYFAERGTWDPSRKAFVNSDGLTSPFDSIPAAFWYVIVTITTTGYGDIVPTTFLGKLIAFPLMMIGILLIALPSVIVGQNLTVVWDVLKRRRLLDSASRDQHMSHQSLSEMMEGIELELEQATNPRVIQADQAFSGAGQTPAGVPLNSLRGEVLVHLKAIQAQQDIIALYLKALHDQFASNEKSTTHCTN